MEANKKGKAKASKESAAAAKKRKEDEESERLIQEEMKKKAAEQHAQLMEDFKQKDRAHLEMIHAFGSFTGRSNIKELDPKVVPLKNPNQFMERRMDPDGDVVGHLHIFEDTCGMFFEPEKPVNEEEEEKTMDPSNIDKASKSVLEMREQNVFGFNAKEQKALLEERPNPFKGLVAMYPVGRHIAFRSLETNRMRFLKLPNEVHSVQAIRMAHETKDKLAVAVRIYKSCDEVKDMIDLSIMFFELNGREFTRVYDESIKLTQATSYQDALPVVMVTKRMQKLGNKEVVVPFERFVQDLQFSNDNKTISVVIRNGPEDSILRTYDYFVMKKQRYSSSTAFPEQIIHNFQFLQDRKRFIVAGEMIFKYYGGIDNSHEITNSQDYEDVPTTMDTKEINDDVYPITYTNFAQMDNDQIVGVTNFGHIFIIEVMTVVQVIKNIELVEPGTPDDKGSRLNLKKVVQNKFGFTCCSDDILYFFKFEPTKKKENDQGKKKDGVAKGYYHCVFKWRAKEFRKTKILDLYVHEGAKETESVLGISTKDGQIIYVDLYSQIYFPGHQQINQEIKTQDDDDLENDSAIDGSMQSEISNLQNMAHKEPKKALTVGIREEMSIDIQLEDALLQKVSSHEQKKRLDELEQQERIERVNYTVAANNGFHKGEISNLEICVQRPIIATMSKMDSTIRIWNYETGECEVLRDFTTRQERAAENDQIYLQSISLHPSGFYMAIAYVQMVEIVFIKHLNYHIFQTLELRGCSMVKFSNGGHLLVGVFPKDIRVYQAFNLQHYMTIQNNAQVADITFNHDDTVMCIVSKSNHFVKKYNLTDCKQILEGVTERGNQFQRALFSKEKRVREEVKDEKEGQQLKPKDIYEDMLYVVGVHEQKMFARLYDEKENPIPKGEEYPFVIKPHIDNTEFTQLAMIRKDFKKFTREKQKQKKEPFVLKNLLMATDSGKIFIYGVGKYFKSNLECEVMNTHFGAITAMKVHYDSSIVATAGKDGSVIVYRVNQVPNKMIGQYFKKLDKQSDKLRRSQLVRSPVVSPDPTHDEDEKEEVQAARLIDDSDTEESDDECKPRKRFAEELYDLIDTRLSNISLVEKSMMEDWRKQQDELRQTMEKQSASVEEDLKNARVESNKRIEATDKLKKDQLKELNDRYNKLQQEEAELKDENTQTMKTMNLQHIDYHNELQNLYEKKIQLEQDAQDRLRQAKEEEKAHYEDRIKQMQKGSENAIEQLLTRFKEQLKEVQDNYDRSKRKADGIKMQYEEKITQQDDDDRGETKQLNESNQLEIRELQDVIDTIKENIETIKMQAQREEQEKINYEKAQKRALKKKSEREESLQRKKEETSKLTEEKNEIQKNLKIKVKELFNLKFQIKKLELTKQVLTHRTQEMKASLEPKEQQIESLKENLLQLEDCYNKQSQTLKSMEEDKRDKEKKIEELKTKVVKEKSKTLEKERKITRFVNEVQRAYKNKNDDKCIEDLMEIYKNHVKEYIESILDQKRKDPETIDELSRQLHYIKKSIDVLRNATSKVQKKTKKEIIQRRDDNKKLIDKLESVRERRTFLAQRKKGLDLEIGELRLEGQKQSRELEKKMQEVLKRVNAKEAQLNEETKLVSNTNRGAITGVNPRGFLYKGTPFLRGNAEDKAKINDYKDRIKDNSEQLLLLTLEKRSLQETIIHLINERADGIQMSDEERRAHFSRLNLPTDGMNNLNVNMPGQQPGGLDSAPNGIQNRDIQ